MSESKAKAVPSVLKQRLSKIHVLTHTDFRHLFPVITDLRGRACFWSPTGTDSGLGEVSLLQKTNVDLASTKIAIQRLEGRPSGMHTVQRDEAVALENISGSEKTRQRSFSWVYAVMPSLVEISTGL